MIPYARPSIGDAEIAEVEACLRSGWLSTGPRAQRFERELAASLGVKHALGACSGTAALHLAVLAAGIGAGDEVITTPMTFCATINAIVHAGATPVLADIDPATTITDLAALARLYGAPMEASVVKEIGHIHPPFQGTPAKGKTMLIPKGFVIKGDG